MLDSPLAASLRGVVFRHGSRKPPRERGLRILSAFAAVLLHLVFLLAFVLGPAYQYTPPVAAKEQFIQLRLIAKPEPPPPPPVRGTPPKQLGPRRQGQPGVAGARLARAQDASTPPPAHAEAPSVATPAPALPALRSLVPPAQTPPVTPLRVKPVELAIVPPAVALAQSPPQPAEPRTFQPEPAPKPQPEGNQPVLPPVSVDLPRQTAKAVPTIVVPTIALDVRAPATPVLPSQPEPPAPAPSDTPAPLPAPPLAAPDTVKLAAPGKLSMSVTAVPVALPKLVAPALPPSDAPQVPLPKIAVPLPSTRLSPSPKVAVDKAAATPEVARPQLSPAEPADSTPAPAAPAVEVAASPATSAPGQTAEASRDAVPSQAPNATVQGSDFATPGQPEGVDKSPVPAAAAGRQASSGASKGKDAAVASAGNAAGAGQPGGGEHGEAVAPPGYVQLRPHGDTEILRHSAPDIGYRPTRFEQDWTPEGESSVDTALRRAVEKTTVSHTFHLPRGIRVECKVMPLLPMALFGCGNPDPPAKPIAAKEYDRLHLAPAKPLAPPPPASVAEPAIASAPIKLDNSAECAAARVSGGPLPPDCAGIAPVKPALALPARSSSSWLPASDQFH